MLFEMLIREQDDGILELGGWIAHSCISIWADPQDRGIRYCIQFSVYRERGGGNLIWSSCSLPFTCIPFWVVLLLSRRLNYYYFYYFMCQKTEALYSISLLY